MLNSRVRDGPSPKCYFSSTVLPTFVNRDQIPTKKKPFSTISNQSFSHTLSIILPQDGVEHFRQVLADGLGTLQYAKVYMKPSDLINGDFFNQFIKTGNVLMLSEGRQGHDHIFTLCEGILRLEVDKVTYERMGLDGVSIPNEGRKHVKARYAIELNLRLPSMVRGQKGFERIIWAFKNVLDHTIAWLFYDMKGKTDGSGPIGSHNPKVITVEPEYASLDAVGVAELPAELQQADYGAATELLEWLTLAMAGCPRIQSQDEIDPYLSRYRFTPGNVNASHTMEQKTQDLVRVYWHGFIPAIFIRDVFLAALKSSGTDWFGLSAIAFGGKTYSFLQNDLHTMTWEYEG